MKRQKKIFHGTTFGLQLTSSSDTALLYSISKMMSSLVNIARRQRSAPVVPQRSDMITDKLLFLSRLNLKWHLTTRKTCVFSGPKEEMGEEPRLHQNVRKFCRFSIALTVIKHCYQLDIAIIIFFVVGNIISRKSKHHYFTPACTAPTPRLLNNKCQPNFSRFPRVIFSCQYKSCDDSLW